MNHALAPFRHRYMQGFEDHLAEPDERTLHVAYELGRDAVADGLGVLEVAAVHHDVLLDAVRRDAGGGAERLTTAAGAFLLETLSAYEMVRRGFQEVVDLAALERRQAQAIRRLSDFLGDRSLATDDPESLDEVLRLVVEEALELVDAAGCIVAVRSNQGSFWQSAASPDDLARAPVEVTGRHNLAVHASLQAGGGVLRLTIEELEAHPAVAEVPGLGHRPRGWLGASIRALDGRAFGFVEVCDWEGPGPTELDEALIVHLAQMAAATIERRRLYQS